MADKNIGSLKKASYLSADSLLIAEQQGEAVAVEGALFINFARQAVEPQADRAEAAATSAENIQRYVVESRNAAENAASAAATSENNASKYSNAASTSEKNAKASEEVALSAKTAAESSEKNAKASQQAAAASESSAVASEKNAKTSEENAKTCEENALASKISAAASAQRIEDMGVAAFTIAHDKEATVTKESGADAVKLIFGIPGGKSAYQYAVDADYTGTEKEFGELLRANAGVSYVADGGKPGSIDNLVFDGGTPFTTDELNVDGGMP